MANFQEKHGDKIRFVIVGGANTALDFLILFLLVHAGMDKIIANYISTSVALIFSFFANKSFTFKDKSDNAKKQFAIFLIITLAGLWILQPLIIWIVTSSLQSHITNQTSLLFVAKMIATVASLIWNYILYSRIVFKKEDK